MPSRELARGCGTRSERPLRIALVLLVAAFGCDRSKTTPAQGGVEGSSTRSASAPTPDTATRKAKLSQVKFRHAGYKRRALVYVPKGVGAKAPVVFAFHGGGGNADGTRAAYGLEKVADREGFVVVYPEGLGKKVLGKHFGVWAVGEVLHTTPHPDADDVGFVRALLKRVLEDFPVDASRVYATGLSNGSMISLTLACEMSQQFAAVVATGAVMPSQGCKPARAVPVLYVAGRQDPCSPYEGGQCGGCWAKAMKGIGLRRKPIEYAQCEAVPTFTAGRAALMGCAAAPTPVDSSAGVACEDYLGCRDGAVLRACVVQELGHVWPGGDYVGCQQKQKGKLCAAYIDAVGPSSDALDLATYGWEWMSRFQLPS